MEKHEAAMQCLSQSEHTKDLHGDSELHRIQRALEAFALSCDCRAY